MCLINRLLKFIKITALSKVNKKIIIEEQGVATPCCQS